MRRFDDDLEVGCLKVAADEHRIEKIFLDLTLKNDPTKYIPCNVIYVCISTRDSFHTKFNIDFIMCWDFENLYFLWILLQILSKVSYKVFLLNVNLQSI
jgi:hypothetical protein